MNKFLKAARLTGMAYFILPFLIWIVAGGLLLVLQDDKATYLAVNNWHSDIGDHFWAYVTYLGTFPFILIMLGIVFLWKRYRTKRFLVAAISCNVVPFLLVQWLKSLFNAPRPLNYFQDATWIHFVAGQPRHYNLSFPSGHSEGAFAIFCFLALLLPPRYQKWGILFFLLALMVGFSRIYLSQHFLKDVYAGSLIGAISVLVVFALIKPAGNRSIKKYRHDEQGTSDGDYR